MPKSSSVEQHLACVQPTSHEELEKLLFDQVRIRERATDKSEGL